MDEVKKIAFKYAIKNAFEHDGRAQVGAVIGKVKALSPQTNLKEAIKTVQEIVNEVNELDSHELKKEYDKFSEKGWELKNESKEKTLEELDWIKPGTKLITRVAPNPSGVMHFGHARPSVLTDEYVKKYGGEFILRFDDTDPKTKKPIQGIEQDFINDYNWLGIKFHKIARASDRLARYYEVIKELIKMNKAYVCFCESEEWRKLIWESKPCPCRTKQISEQLINWKKMLSHEIKEGIAVVRLKTDLSNPDPSERDWWLAKVVDEVEHPNLVAKQNHVWPSYNLASAVDDNDMGINFIIRGQEHLTNGDKQKVLYDYFGWSYPRCYYHGKVSNIGDMTLSKSRIKIIMDQLGVERYDDPRMATIKAFKRRGFMPQAIRKLILDSGLSLKEVKLSMDAFAAANKLFLGKINEYPFFEEKILLKITNLSKGEIEDYGGTKIIINEEEKNFFVDKKEINKYNEEEKIRLKKAFEIKLIKKQNDLINAEFLSYNKTKSNIVSWVSEFIQAELLMSDGSIKKGFTSKNILSEEGIIRLEGIGYSNIEEKQEEKIRLVFTHE